MRVALVSKEYPPEVYGGAGVHVEYLARELARLEELSVHAWGADRDGVHGHEAWDALAGDAPHLSALRAMSIDLSMAAGVEGCELVHSHTWYANLAGHLAKLTYDVPHVATVRRSVLSPGVHLHSYAEVEDSILFPGVDVARSAVVHRAILDKDVRVLEGAQIGVDLDADRERFAVSAGGVVVVGKGAVVEA